MDPRFVKALDHVVRQHILLAAVQGEVSPNSLSKTLDEGLSQISYHVKVLRDDCDEMIEATRREPRRGAIEHFYRATDKTLLPAKTWRRVKKGMRAVIGAGQASDLFNDLAEALKAGKLQGAHDHIVRTPLVLDVEGERNLKAIAQRATREVEDEQRAAGKRMGKANGDRGKRTGYTFALLAFEAAWNRPTRCLSEPSARRPNRRAARTAADTTAAVERAAAARRGQQAARATRGCGGRGRHPFPPAPDEPSSEGCMTDRTDTSQTPAKYEPAKVEAVMLEIVTELHPRHLTDDELSRQIVADPGDSREIGTAAEAIRNLRESDLLHDRDDGILEPTRAALHAVTLLAGQGAQSLTF